MNIADILQAVSTVGFPIVMCFAACWYCITQTKEHKEEMTKITEAINNNTVVMSQMLEHIRKEDENE